MAFGVKKFFLYGTNGRAVTSSTLIEAIFKGIAVSADGNDNGLNITESSGKFNFNSKVLGGIGTATASGEAVEYDQYTTALSGKLSTSLKGAANGLAELDAGGKVPATQLPNSIMEYKGAFNPSTGVPNLQNNGSAIKASLIIQDLTFDADTAGGDGNAITIEYTDGATAGSEVVGVIGNAISVQIESGVSTATQVKDAIDAFGAAAALVDVTISGTAGNAQTAPVSATPLAGGADAVSPGDVYRVTADGSHDFGAGSISFNTGDYAVANSSGIFEKSDTTDAVSSVNSKTGAVTLVTDDIAEDGEPVNLWFTAARAKSAAVADIITDGVTDVAPSQNAVYDALAGKSDTTHNHDGSYAALSHTHTASNITDFASAAKSAAVSDSITDGVTDVAPSQNAVFDALAGKSDTSHNHDGSYAALSHSHAISDVTNLQTTLDGKDDTSDRYTSYTNKEGSAITVGQFVFMSAAGEVTLLDSTDAVNEDTLLGCVKDTSIDNDAAGAIWLPKMGTRVGGFTGLTVGGRLFAHASTPGSYTQTRPTSGKVLVLGHAVSATDIVFEGYYDYEYGT